MNVLHLTNRLAHNGTGITNVAVDLAMTQARNGHRVHVASAGGSFLPMMIAAGVTHTELPIPKHSILAYRRSVAQLLDQWPADVVHAHNVASTVAARAALMPRQRRIPLVATVHNEFQVTAPLMGVADRVVAVSDAVRDSLTRRRVPRRRIVVVTNTTYHSPRRPARDVIIPAHLDPPAVLFVGGWSRRKGIDVLLDAFDELVRRGRSPHLYIAGNPDRDDIGDRISHAHGRERIHVLGFADDPRELMAGADLVVVPSLRDPNPLVIAEAREVGVAVVASSVDGIPAALDDGAAGCLVPPGDPVALAEAIERVLTDDVLREKLAAAAKLPEDARGVDDMAADYISIYRDATGCEVA